jgi:hypothetical protein
MPPSDLATKSSRRSQHPKRLLLNGASHLRGCLSFPLNLTEYRNETFSFVAGTFTPKLYIWIHDHKTLGKDKLLCEGEIDVRLVYLSWILSLTRCIRSGGTSNPKAFQQQRSRRSCRVAVWFACGWISTRTHSPQMVLVLRRREQTRAEPCRYRPHLASVYEGVAQGLRRTVIDPFCKRLRTVNIYLADPPY